MSTQPVVLVTGGAGYIGSHTCKALAKNGFVPVTVDDLSTGFQENVQFGPLEQGSITDATFMAEVMRKHQPAAVLHFAAKLVVPESITNPAPYYHTNVHGTWCLLQAMREQNVQHIVFSSSAAVYGMSESGIADETHPQNPINPYGRTKKMMEQMLTDYSQAYGMGTVALRYFNAAGAEQGLGPRNPTPSNLIPVCAEVLAGTQSKLTVYGIDYPTPDGTAVRDYIHVEDLADAHVKALTYLQNGGESTAFNLGTNKGHSVKEVVHMMKNVSDKPLPVTYTERRAGDPAQLVADARKAQQVLGWQPAHSTLHQICQSAWVWRQSLS